MPNKENLEGEVDFKPTHPDEIFNCLEIAMSQVQVIIADKEKGYLVPEGWTKENERVDVMVNFGKVLIEPIAGTELMDETFANWLDTNGSTFEVWDEPSDAQRSGELLMSEKSEVEGRPVFRAVRPARENEVPVMVEIYNLSGSNCGVSSRTK